jgi:phospholipid/cholesterol/gamma-HCH transport system substrate-binding protein
METRANFILIGAFTLSAVVGAFLFVMWIIGYGTSGVHRHYQIVFNGSVSGLSNGALVLFNGLKVGEVTNLSFVENNPNQVVADIDVTNASAPINSNTKAQLETQGLTGSATVALMGGEEGGGELAGKNGRPPQIPALPTATLADLQTKAGYVLDLANKLLVDNAEPIHKTIENAQTFSMALANNTQGVDAALKGMADLGKQIEPLATRLQTLSEDADKLVKSISAEKVGRIVDNAQTFTDALANSSKDYTALMRDGSTFVSKLNETSKQLDSAITDLDNIVKAIDPQKVAGIVDSISGVADTVRENRGNIDETLRNASEISAKLNQSASKLDGLIASAQSFLGSPDTKGALAQLGDAAQSVKKLADDVDARVKEISVGLNRFSNSGLRQYEALAVQGQRVLEDIDQAVRSFKQNPGQIIWGAKSSLPEYRGGQ